MLRTGEDKNNVLTQCHDYARYEFGIYPHKISPCCVAVREVPGRDMECIIDLLTTVEKNIYDVHSIMEYHRIYDDTPAPQWWERRSPPPHLEEQRTTVQDKDNLQMHCWQYTRHGTTISPHRNSHCRATK